MKLISYIISNMETPAIIFMVVAESIITGLILYFFIRVMKAKPVEEADSYIDLQ